ncbi:crossover junction endodeoxyribonuclease RuvC [Patescibacteria group bacterium]
MIIIGIDPGTARLGWGVIKTNSGQQTVDKYGCLETPKTDLEPKRLESLFNNFKKLLKKHQPDAVVVEDIFFSKNQKTVIKVSQARGVILLASQLQKIPTFSYTPPQIKLAVTGYGKADKRQVQQMTKTILKLPSIPKPDDTADALAVALTHAFSYKLKNKLK